MLHFSVLLIWILVNSHYLLSKPIDPFPFVLLNLILSCLAVIQAPVIMMSQHRQEARDRIRAKHDYEIADMKGIVRAFVGGEEWSVKKREYIGICKALEQEDRQIAGNPGVTVVVLR